MSTAAILFLIVAAGIVVYLVSRQSKAPTGPTYTEPAPDDDVFPTKKPEDRDPWSN